MTKHISKIKNITSYFRKLINNKYDNSVRVHKLCNMLDEKPEKLKHCLLEIESIIFGSTFYINETQLFIWRMLKHKWLPVYDRVLENDYDRIYNFFLLMTHNIPIIPNYSDSCIPGCVSVNKIYEFKNLKRKYDESSQEICDAIDKLNKYKKDNYNTFYIHPDMFNNIIPISEYMRVEQWINKDKNYNKFFGCLCEKHF